MPLWKPGFCLILIENQHKYNNNAELDFTVNSTSKRLIVRFSGTGYPENGESEKLERIYIFDIENVGGKKLPKLLNRAEFIGY